MIGTILFILLSVMAGSTLTSWLAAKGAVNSRGMMFASGSLSAGGTSFALGSFSMLQDYLLMAASGQMGATGLLMVVSLATMLAVWAFNLYSSEGRVMIR